FPGMDPYLENPIGSNDFHLEMITGIRAALNQHLPSGYYARIDERVYRSGPDDPGRSVLVGPLDPTIPVTLMDDRIHDSYLKVIDTLHRRVVTVIELPKPVNKVVGSCGLESFRENRDRTMRSSRHWVEIDLLRQGYSFIPRQNLPDHE